MEWDTGAGHAIAKMAGFSVTQYNTEKEVVYNKEDLLNPWFLVN
jgi:3'(2'), 5'-bisphosphate nucleotidase